MILSQYVPETFVATTAQEYAFQFENVGPESVEVYEIDVEGVRTLIPASGYNIRLKPDLLPLYRGGVVEFTRDHLSGTVKIAVERNTRITQLLDFTQAEDFPARMVEFALDKATIICQEIAQRKCTAVTGIEITQTMTFQSYGYFPAEAITAALAKITQILKEISETAQDCRSTPGKT